MIAILLWFGNCFWDFSLFACFLFHLAFLDVSRDLKKGISWAGRFEVLLAVSWSWGFASCSLLLCLLLGYLAFVYRCKPRFKVLRGDGRGDGEWRKTGLGLDNGLCSCGPCLIFYLWKLPPAILLSLFLFFFGLPLLSLFLSIYRKGGLRAVGVSESPAYVGQRRA